MVMLPMPLNDSEPPQTTPVSTFCVFFHIFVMDEHKNFKFGGKLIMASPSLYIWQTVPLRGVVTYLA